MLITGPESKVSQVVKVIATVDMNNVTTSISRAVELKPHHRLRIATAMALASCSRSKNTPSGHQLS